MTRGFTWIDQLSVRANVAAIWCDDCVRLVRSDAVVVKLSDVQQCERGLKGE